MNASRTAHPRTRPVALRAKSDGSTDGSTRPAALSIPLLLSARHDEALDLLSFLEIDDGPEQLSLLVGATGVDAERATDPRVPARLVDMAVQRQHRLVLLYRITHGGRAQWDRGSPRVLEPHVLREL